MGCISPPFEVRTLMRSARAIARSGCIYFHHAPRSYAPLSTFHPHTTTRQNGTTPAQKWISRPLVWWGVAATATAMAGISVYMMSRGPPEEEVKESMARIPSTWQTRLAVGLVPYLSFTSPLSSVAVQGLFFLSRDRRVPLVFLSSASYSCYTWDSGIGGAIGSPRGCHPVGMLFGLLGESIRSY